MIKRKTKTVVSSAPLKKFVLKALDDLQASEVTTLDVRSLTTIADYIVVCSGRSSRHIHSVAEHLVEQAKANHFTVIGLEGKQSTDWVLVDLGDVVVHIMSPETRCLYALEQLWSA